MDTMRGPGTGIGRHVAAGQRVEAELSAFISRLYEQRRKGEPERETEATWAAAEKLQEAARRCVNIHEGKKGRQSLRLLAKKG